MEAVKKCRKYHKLLFFRYLFGRNVMKFQFFVVNLQMFLKMTVLNKSFVTFPHSKLSNHY
jgi:hypothetical protein